MNEALKIAAYVLVGGKSKRFGSPKHLATIDGVTLLDRILDVLPRDWPVTLVGQRDTEWEAFATRKILDQFPNGGPARAVETVLNDAGGRGANWAFITSCDVLDLTERHCELLADHTSHGFENVDAILFEAPAESAKAKRLEPFPGCYRADVARSFSSLPDDRSGSGVYSMQNVFRTLMNPQCISLGGLGRLHQANDMSAIEEWRDRSF